MLAPQKGCGKSLCWTTAASLSLAAIKAAPASCSPGARSIAQVANRAVVSTAQHGRTAKGAKAVA